MQQTAGLSVLYELRTMLREMERDVGLQNLTATEMDVLLAAHDVSDSHGAEITSDSIRRHATTCDIAQATYHRALKSLLAMGLLEKAQGSKSGLYVVNMRGNDQ